MFVCNFLIVSKKLMFQCVFAGAKGRSGEIAKFQFLISANWGVATFSLQKFPKRIGDIFPFSFFYAKPGLWIKTNFSSPAIPWHEPLTTQKGGNTMELHGKIRSSLYSTSENVPSNMYAQRIFRSVWLIAFWIDKNVKFLHADKGYADWFESSFGAHVRRYCFWCCDLFLV